MFVHFPWIQCPQSDKSCVYTYFFWGEISVIIFVFIILRCYNNRFYIYSKRSRDSLTMWSMVDMNLLIHIWNVQKKYKWKIFPLRIVIGYFSIFVCVMISQSFVKNKWKLMIKFEKRSFCGQIIIKDETSDVK